MEDRVRSDIILILFLLIANMTIVLGMEKIGILDVIMMKFGLTNRSSKSLQLLIRRVISDVM